MSEALQLTDKQKNLIEKVGVYHEKAGMTPASARILSLLLISPETDLTFDQIRDTLNLSKSATSNALNMLLNLEKVDYSTKSGDRKRYFRNKIGSWRTEVKDTYKKIAVAADILEEVLRERPGHTTEFNNNLRDVIDFMRFINDELPALYKRWEEQQK